MNGYVWLALLCFIIILALLISMSINKTNAQDLPEIIVTVEDDGVIFVRDKKETLVIFCNPKNIHKWVLYNRKLSKQEIEYLFEMDRKYPDPDFGKDKEK